MQLFVRSLNSNVKVVVVHWHLLVERHGTCLSNSSDSKLGKFYPCTTHAVLTYHPVVCSSFRVADTMFFSLVVLLAYMTIGQKQVDKFINSQTPNTGHTKIDGKQNLHTWSTCKVMVGMCSMVLPYRGHLLTCRHQVRGDVLKQRN